MRPLTLLREADELLSSRGGMTGSYNGGERGAILVMTLVMIAFVSALGISLMVTASSFLSRARLHGVEARAKALAEGGVSVAFSRINQSSFGEVADSAIREEVSFSDGVKGAVTVQTDAKNGVVRSTGTVGGVNHRLLVKFGVD